MVLTAGTLGLHSLEVRAVSGPHTGRAFFPTPPPFLAVASHSAFRSTEGLPCHIIPIPVPSPLCYAVNILGLSVK